LEEKSMHFFQYQIKPTTTELRNFIKQFGISEKRLNIENIHLQFSVKANKLYVKDIIINSYIAADIAEFIRQTLLAKGKSFSFETVLSHPSKLELIKKAKQLGYKININRVGIRVAKHGHKVSSEVIIKRYTKSLEQLFETVKLSNRAYLFDNSGKYYELIAEVANGKVVQITNVDKNVPSWFLKYFYNKIK
jgi:predicted ABC-type ATPase